MSGQLGEGERDLQPLILHEGIIAALKPQLLGAAKVDRCRSNAILQEALHTFQKLPSLVAVRLPKSLQVELSSICR